jgi:hypothetical protein
MWRRSQLCTGSSSDRDPLLPAVARKWSRFIPTLKRLARLHDRPSEGRRLRFLRSRGYVDEVTASRSIASPPLHAQACVLARSRSGSPS